MNTPMTTTRLSPDDETKLQQLRLWLEPGQILRKSDVVRRLIQQAYAALEASEGEGELFAPLSPAKPKAKAKKKGSAK